ncbi:hypothetical protein GF338_10845 [candidate division WOR-3 bacterium]|nr:hypothetical protein [candidate division WOR-3 bacterium]
MSSETLDLNQIALEAFVRLEEARNSVGESIRLQHAEDNPYRIKKLITSGKLAMAQAWRLIKALDESYAG